MQSLEANPVTVCMIVVASRIRIPPKIKIKTFYKQFIQVYTVLYIKYL